MACNNCERCNFYINTDCVISDADALWWESVRDGSPRTLSEVLAGIPDCCNDLTSYIVQSSYTIQDGDQNKILLLQGDDESTEDAGTTHVLTLPSSADLVGKVIRVKNMSELDQYGNSINWVFSDSVKYDFENNLSSTSFATLANSLHKVLYLVYLKTADNEYSWMAISPNQEDLTPLEEGITDLQDQVVILSSQTTVFSAETTVNEIIVEDGDMQNGWLTFTGSTVVVHYTQNTVTFQGLVSVGTSGTTFYTLPSYLRPEKDLVFVSAYGGASPWIVLINVTTLGQVQLSVPALSGMPIDGADYVSLCNIHYYININTN